MKSEWLVQSRILGHYRSRHHLGHQRLGEFLIRELTYQGFINAISQTRAGRADIRIT
jgi:hypothetical protein